MSIFSEILAFVEAEWKKIFGGVNITISQTVVTDINLIASGLNGALAAFEAVTGLDAAAVAAIQKDIVSIVAAASTLATTVETNVAKPVAQQIAADFASLESVLSGVTLPPALKSILNAAATLLPYVEAAVGILTSSTVAKAEATGLTADEARLILKAN